MKSTSCVIDGEDRMLFKDPKTDDGTKKSLKGACVVQKNGMGEYLAVDGLRFQNYAPNELKTIFEDGITMNPVKLSEIRKRVAEGRN
jgi:nicotinamide phosphoribosyltransferase